MVVGGGVVPVVPEPPVATLPGIVLPAALPTVVIAMVVKVHCPV